VHDVTIELKDGEGVLFLRTKGAAEAARRIRAGERYVIRFDRNARRYDLSRVLRP
jgi:hypothetical protein